MVVVRGALRSRSAIDCGPRILVQAAQCGVRPWEASSGRLREKPGFTDSWYQIVVAIGRLQSGRGSSRCFGVATTGSN